MKHLIYCLVVLCNLVLHTGFISGQQSKSLFQELSTYETLKLELTTDLEVLLEKANQEVDGTLSYNDPQDSLHLWNVKVEPRGKYRRKVCDFPPLFIDLKKGDLRDQGYAEYDKYKLVTHCLDSPEGKLNVLKEFLIYKLYSLMTDQSYNVVLADITYRDQESGKKIKGSGFIIEPTDEVVDRLGGKEHEQYNLPQDSLSADNYNRIALFQFMVGNSDWNLMMARNIKIVRGVSPEKCILVPYDFDFSAVVMPSYIRLNADYGVTDIRDRVFLGEYFGGDLKHTIYNFVLKKDELLEYCNSFKPLPKTIRKSLAQYLEDFYTFITESPEHLSYKFILPYDPK